MVRHLSGSLIACNNDHARKSGPMWFCCYFVFCFFFFFFLCFQNRLESRFQAVLDSIPDVVTNTVAIQ